MRKKAGQVAMEYALIIGVAALALVGMRLYFQRGIQSAVKIAADEMGDPDHASTYDVNKGGLSSSNMRNTATSTTVASSQKDGSQATTVNSSSAILPIGYDENNVPIYSSTTYTQSE